jgi:hypothetical protein
LQVLPQHRKGQSGLGKWNKDGNLFHVPWPGIHHYDNTPQPEPEQCRRNDRLNLFVHLILSRLKCFDIAHHLIDGLFIGL